uniref:Uncharacterized protein n=1 Tax=Oryza glumipatula TaxID=40148 RepID=A0A0E0AKZ8_9ORYZ
MVFGKESELLGRLRWGGCALGFLACLQVCWGESELLVGDKLGNDNPPPLSLVALWLPGVS